MKRIVLDTNILTSGFRSRQGASFKILRLIADRALTPLVTTALFLEYEAVLKRPEQMEVHGMSLFGVDDALAGFAHLAEGVNVHFRWRPQLGDPQDELVLEAAVNGRADALVTYNVRDFLPIRDRFEIRVVQPVELLEQIR